MTLSEELDKIIDKHKVDVSYVGRLESFKIEILALIERKLNEVVPEYKTSNDYDCYALEKAMAFNSCLNQMLENIKKVLEGK